MDICPICTTAFKRHYSRKGQRQIYCSKACRYKSMAVTRICLTCEKPFTVNRFSTRQDYCSKPCIARYPCQLCGTIITGRKTFQSGPKRFCTRKCASIFNRSLTSKKAYVVTGFAQTIHRKGALLCERCNFHNPFALIVHHRDSDRSNNTPENLETLCANCHAIEHWKASTHREAVIKVAYAVAPYHSLR